MPATTALRWIFSLVLSLVVPLFSTHASLAGSSATIVWDGKGALNGAPADQQCNLVSDPYLVFILAGTGISNAKISTNTGIFLASMTKVKTGSNSSAFKYTYFSSTPIDLATIQVSSTYDYISTRPTLTLGYGCLGVSSDLVGYWNFDTSSAIGAPSKAGISLIARGDAQYTGMGKRSGGLLLDGVGDYLSPDPTTAFPNLPTGNSAYTLAAWINPYEIRNTNFNGIIGWGNYGSVQTCNALRLAGSALLNYWWGNDVSGGIVSAGAFQHVAVTYDGSVRILYVDGVEVRRDTPNSANNSVYTNFAIGFTAPTYEEYFSGVIDDVVIYKRALSISEINRVMTYGGF